MKNTDVHVVRKGGHASPNHRSVVQKPPTKWTQQSAERMEGEGGGGGGEGKEEAMEEGGESQEKSVTSLDADDPFSVNELIQQETDY